MDCTGSGDIDTSAVATADEAGCITGASGRQLLLLPLSTGRVCHELHRHLSCNFFSIGLLLVLLLLLLLLLLLRPLSTGRICLGLPRHLSCTLFSTCLLPSLLLLLLLLRPLQIIDVMDCTGTSRVMSFVNMPASWLPLLLHPLSIDHRCHGLHRQRRH
jgi:hypothetical protein